MPSLLPSTLLLSLLTLSTAQHVEVVTMTSTIAGSTVNLAAQETSTALSSTYTDRSTFQTSILNSTNYFRYLHPAQYLSHNASLASFAQSYSQKCKWQHNPDLGKVGYGENLARGYGDTTSAVDAWGNEASLYSFSDSSYTGFSEETGHFTQLVWRGTTSVGCGWTDCAGKNGLDGVLLVCNYYPAGNIEAPSNDGGNVNIFFRENVVPQRSGGGSGFNAEEAGRGVGGPSGTATASVAGTVTASAGAVSLRGGSEGAVGLLGSLAVVGVGLLVGGLMF